MREPIEFNAEELCALIQVTFNSLVERMDWTLRRNVRSKIPGGWWSLPWETAQESIDTLVSLYTKAMMSLKDMETDGQEIVPEFMTTFTPQPEVWELLSQITLADEWDSAPEHAEHSGDCPVCYQLSLA